MAATRTGRSRRRRDSDACALFVRLLYSTTFATALVGRSYAAATGALLAMDARWILFAMLSGSVVDDFDRPATLGVVQPVLLVVGPIRGRAGHIMHLRLRVKTQALDLKHRHGTNSRGEASGGRVEEGPTGVRLGWER